ncbi:hypothetical protein [Limisalsivibrio acetivorans]|uniref:hypothetical protein n=1 Tax=Limisalsivibrio acetivorans TaxID=1304888 RepID=UPI0003B64687|nr:hypothetical protein [Limisalsivibrio acetivorans]
MNIDIDHNELSIDEIIDECISLSSYFPKIFHDRGFIDVNLIHKVKYFSKNLEETDKDILRELITIFYHFLDNMIYNYDFKDSSWLTRAKKELSPILYKSKSLRSYEIQKILEEFTSSTFSTLRKVENDIYNIVARDPNKKISIGDLHRVSKSKNKDNGERQNLELQEYIDTTKKRASQLLASLEQNIKQVEKVEEQEVTDKLKKSFSDRAETVCKNKNNWFKITLSFSVIAIISVLFVLGLFDNYWHTSDIPSVLIIKRSFVAVFSLIILSFSFSQYNKEREIEEAYRFKEAVASSTPTFRDLAVDQVVKDKILEESTSVMYRSPYDSTKKLKVDGRKTNVDDLVTLMDKLKLNDRTDIKALFEILEKMKNVTKD